MLSILSDDDVSLAIHAALTFRSLDAVSDCALHAWCRSRTVAPLSTEEDLLLIFMLSDLALNIVFDFPSLHPLI